MPGEPFHGDPALPDYNDVARELERDSQENPPFAIEMTAAMAFMVIAAIQVASRHPESKGRLAQSTTDFARVLAMELPPLARQAAEAGFLPEHDAPTGEDG